MASYDSDQTVIGAASRVTGRINGAGSLRVEGTLKGDASITGGCEVVEGGSISGNVEAASLDVAGTLEGDAISRGPVVIRSQASAAGTIQSEGIVIEPGARVSLELDADFELDLNLPPRR